MRKCEVCGGREFKVIEKSVDPDGLTTDYYYLEECKMCGLARVAGDFSYGFMSKFYSSDYYPQGFFSGMALDFFSKIRLRKILRFKAGGNLLDVGCGDGRFLLTCKKAGFGASGIEGGEAARRAAFKKGLFIYPRDLLMQDFKSKKFDVITLWQVLEHIDSQNFYLKKIKKIIKKDGLLYIGLPNIDSLQYKIFRRFWFHLDLPRHLFAYNPKTLSAILEKNGFRVIKLDYNYLEYNPFGFFQSFFNVILPLFNFPYKMIKRGKNQTLLPLSIAAL